MKKLFGMMAAALMLLMSWSGVAAAEEDSINVPEWIAGQQAMYDSHIAKCYGEKATNLQHHRLETEIGQIIRGQYALFSLLLEIAINEWLAGYVSDVPFYVEQVGYWGDQLDTWTYIPSPRCAPMSAEELAN